MHASTLYIAFTEEISLSTVIPADSSLQGLTDLTNEMSHSEICTHYGTSTDSTAVASISSTNFNSATSLSVNNEHISGSVGQEISTPTAGRATFVYYTYIR